MATSKTYSATVNRQTLSCPSSPADKEYTGKIIYSEITCPSGSTAGGDTSGKSVKTYYQTCIAGKGYKFSSTCSVGWKIVKTDPPEQKYTIRCICYGDGVHEMAPTVTSESVNICYSMSTGNKWCTSYCKSKWSDSDSGVCGGSGNGGISDCCAEASYSCCNWPWN